jgi:hypothetical protein
VQDRSIEQSLGLEGATAFLLKTKISRTRPARSIGEPPDIV